MYEILLVLEVRTEGIDTALLATILMLMGINDYNYKGSPEANFFATCKLTFDVIAKCGMINGGILKFRQQSNIKIKSDSDNRRW